LRISRSQPAFYSCFKGIPGQVATSSVAGLVRDPSGDIVPEPEVLLRNLETGTERQTVTNSLGSYVLLSVMPGKYILTVSKPGFRTSNVPEFTLVVDQRATVDIPLQLGELEQSVNVEAVGEAIQSSTADSSVGRANYSAFQRETPSWKLTYSQTR
jgi:hypothetical protein